MSEVFLSCLQIFPSSDMEKTMRFYEHIGFRAVPYLDSSQPHICLYRDSIELILTKSLKEKIEPNRTLHGSGYDGYFITSGQAGMQKELQDKGVQIVRALSVTDYQNNEFVFEDCDGRWIGVGKKEAI